MNETTKLYAFDRQPLSKEVTAQMEIEGYRPANWNEMLNYCDPGEHCSRKGLKIVALGSMERCKGYHRVPVRARYRAIMTEEPYFQTWLDSIVIDLPVFTWPVEYCFLAISTKS